MKKKLYLILLFTFAIALCLFSACHTHEFGEWTVTTEPTCTTDGLQERVCECGEIDSQTIPATNHEFGEWIVTKQATCTEEGLQKRICECGEEETEVIPKGHYFTIVTNTEPATCTKYGTEYLACECGQYKAQRELPALGHDIVQHSAQQPTCTNVGWDAYENCTRCDYTTYYEIPITHKLNGTICEICNVDYVSVGLVFELNDDGQSYTVVDIEGKESHIVIPSTYNDKPVVSIGDGALSSCKDAISVYIPDSITSIGRSAFACCDKLKSVTIPQSVTSVSASMFESCITLESVYISKNVTSIGDYAFFNCRKLTTITFEGEQLQSIGENAFYACYSLTSITIPNGLTTIANTAFSSSGLERIIIPQSVTSIGDSVFSDCIALTEIVVDANNANYKSIDGNLYSKDGTVLICYSAGKTATSFDIPQSVTTIAERAFVAAHLTDITIGGNVTKVEGYAFAGCESLTSVKFTAPLEILERSVFYNCQNLESVTLPSSLKTIGDYTFYNCNKLKSVNYCGTEEQWNLIEKTENWDYTIAKYALNFNYNEK